MMQRLKKLLFLTITTLVLGGITACGETTLPTMAADTPATGQAEFALNQVQGDDDFGFVADINIVHAGTSNVEATVSTDENTATETVTLPLGSYELDIVGVDPDSGTLLMEGTTAAYCTYEGPRDQFGGCTYQQHVPDPFDVLAGETVAVQLVVVYHFVDGDIVVTFGSGDVVLSLLTSTSPDGGVSFCGTPATDAGPASGELCDPGEACLTVQDVLADTPSCYLECVDDDDCTGNDAPVSGSTDCRAVDTLGGDGNPGTDGGLDDPPMVCQPPIGSNADAGADAGSISL